MIRHLLVLIGLLLLISSAFAISTDFLSIDITLNEQGQAEVIEKYSLGFAHSFERNEFLSKEQQYSGNLLLWGSDPDFNFFFPHFVQGNKYETPSSVAFIEQSNTLLLEYGTGDFVNFKRESGRSIVWEINNQVFDSFFDEIGSIKIPTNARIVISLPLNAEIEAETVPAGVQVSGNEIVLSGISTSFEKIEYRVLKPIAPPLSTVDLLTSPEMMMVTIVLLVVFMIVVVKKKSISSRIEEYIVANSMIEIEEEDEDLDLKI